MVTTSDMTYLVRDIVPFIEKMEAAPRRRVMITVRSEPPPNRGAGLFRRVYGEERAREMFDELFSRSAQGFRPLWRSEMPELLITWESRSQG